MYVTPHLHKPESQNLALSISEEPSLTEGFLTTHQPSGRHRPGANGEAEGKAALPLLCPHPAPGSSATKDNVSWQCCDRGPGGGGSRKVNSSQPYW